MNKLAIFIEFLVKYWNVSKDFIFSHLRWWLIGICMQNWKRFGWTFWSYRKLFRTRDDLEFTSNNRYWQYNFFTRSKILESCTFGYRRSFVDFVLKIAKIKIYPSGEYVRKDDLVRNFIFCSRWIIYNNKFIRSIE